LLFKGQLEHSTETDVGKWSVPECPFQIEYSLRVLDDIRLAVVDGFFSLPHGGLEIGGILLGRLNGGRILITRYEALDCEHASGPSFTLSRRDQTLLEARIAEARKNPADRQPVGWYHSHTRSDIFLSVIDQEIHKHFFPELWQVALVLKPHIFEPTRAGFFFRASDGSMRGAASYQEFTLEALPVRPAVSAAGNGLPPAFRTKRFEAMTQPSAEPQSEPPAEAPVKVADVIPPNLGQSKPARSSPVWKAVAYLAIGLAAGGTGYETRDYWLPRVMSAVRPMLPIHPEAPLSLAVSDDNGQLTIWWDRNAAAVRKALDGTMEIADGRNESQIVRLDNAHLASGAFSYSRENERVDVTLIATEPNGQLVKEQVSFLGNAPSQTETTADAEAERAEKLQKDLNLEAAKTRKLERELKEARVQLQNKVKRR
jgi:proteasome lid subunit RPN8/RPN11